MSDPVNHPPHYTAGPACPHCGNPVECITVTEGHDFLTGNAIKYLWRAGLKGDLLTDLKKARRYVDRAIQREQGQVCPERKLQEAHGMAQRGDRDAARRELLGVIVYAAGAMLALDAEDAH